jgi:nucleosome binding factor SPN SPT16 subunit
LPLAFRTLRTKRPESEWTIFCCLNELLFNGTFRYALQLNDTVKIAEDKAIPLTVKFKSAKEVLFFLSAEEEQEPQKAKAGKKAPTKPLANGNPSPTKNKTAGGKVLRNKTRSSAQEEVIQTAWARIAEHQRELHAALQQAGLAKHSEDGGGLTGKEGKGWKRFQSYKGEGALPKETEAQKVHALYFLTPDCPLT